MQRFPIRTRFVPWFLSMFRSTSQAQWALAVGILVVVVFFSLLVLFNLVDPYPLKDWIYLRLTLVDMGFAGVIVYLLMLTFIPLFSPLSLLIVTGAAAYGPFLGTIFSYGGTLLNAMVCFLLVKALHIEDAWGKSRHTQKIKDAIGEHGYSIVLILQLITILPFTLINSAAAASGVSFKDFLRATTLGVIPCVLIYSFVGNRVVADLVSPEVYFAGISVLALTLILVAVRQRHAQDVNEELTEIDEETRHVE